MGIRNWELEIFMLIVPAIIPESKEGLEREIKLVAGFASVIQIDICDGTFTPAKTWPYNGRDTDYFDDLRAEHIGWPEWEKVDFELHLMVSDPLGKISDWISSGISTAVIHIETADNFSEIIDLCRNLNIGVGLALKPSTDLSKIKTFANNVDFIQLMGSDNLGRHGEVLQESAILKLKELRGAFPDKTIAVDIGVNEETAPILAAAGANKLVVGGAILNSDNPEYVYKRLSGN